MDPNKQDKHQRQRRNEARTVKDRVKALVGAAGVQPPPLGQPRVSCQGSYTSRSESGPASGSQTAACRRRAMHFELRPRSATRL